MSDHTLLREFYGDNLKELIFINFCIPTLELLDIRGLVNQIITEGLPLSAKVVKSIARFKWNQWKIGE